MNATPRDQATSPLPGTTIAPEQQAGLARLAFGAVSDPRRADWSISRHLAFLPADNLELDLTDPAQRQFGDYELLEQVGQGGMGVVYRAKQKSLDREVAIKLLSAGPWASTDFIERFRREAQSAARMQHPNIVAIYEIGQHEELNFFSMRLVRGPSLAQLLREPKRLPAKEAARLLRTIAEAVDYAHKLGVLHLDLKPGNVLIDERGEPQVADFGLAKRLDDTLASDTEEISGTPSYMAPEQAQLKRHKLTPATDIYGLGAILYECLTGRPPFLGTDPRDTLKQVVERDPEAPRKLAPDTPLDLDAICFKCLAKEPNQRYRDARELADDLGRFIEGRSVSVRPLTTAQRIGNWARREPQVAGSAATAAVLLVAGLAATSWQWLRADAQAELAQANAERAEASAAAARETAWSARRAEAWRLAEAGDPVSGLRGILASLREQREAGDTSSSRLDHAFVATTLDATPRLIDVIVIGEPVRALAISNDGLRVATMTGSLAVRVFDTASGRELWRSVVPGDAVAGDQTWSMTFAPDDRYLIVDLDVSRGREMFRLDVSTGVVRLPPAAFASLANALYSADGRYALLRNAAGGVQAWRLDPDEPLGPIVNLAQAVRFQIGRHGEIVVVTTRTTTELRDGLTLAAGAIIPTAAESSLSPDSRWLVVKRSSAIDVHDPRSGKRVVQLSDMLGPVSFSEDGSWMALWTDPSFRVVEIGTGKSVTAPYVSHIAYGATSSLLSRKHGWLVLDDGGDNLTAARIGVSAFGSGISVEIPKFRHPRRVASMAAHFDSALLASGGYDGEVRLWRLPRDPAMGIAAPMQPFDRFGFDGRNLPDVRDTTVVVRDARTAEPRSRELVHPQPVQAAQLARDGRTLVSAAGRLVHVWDWAGGTLRYPPIELPATPIRLASDRDTHVLLVSYGENRAEGYHEVFRSHAIADGRLLAERAFPGSYRRVDTSEDGHVAMLYHKNAIERFDTNTLAPLGPAITPETRTTIATAALGRLGTRVYASMVIPNTGMPGVHEEHRWYDAASGRELGRKSAPFPAVAVDASPDGRTLAAQGTASIGELVSLDDAFPTRRYAPSKLMGSAVVRYSRDGRLIFRSGFLGSVVTDARLDHPLTPLLHAGRLIAFRFPSDVAWSDDGERLAVVLAGGQYAYYDLRPTPLDLDHLGIVTETTSPEKYPEPAFRQPLPDRIRRVLRNNDPGPPTKWQRRPTYWSDRMTSLIPPRTEGSAPELVDLTEHYTRPLALHYNDEGAWPGQPLHMLPHGVQRFDGVDYDVRGLILLDAYGAKEAVAAAHSLPGTQWPAAKSPRSIDGIPVAVHRIGAVSALCSLLGWSHAYGKPVAHLTFNYRSGGSARATLVHGVHVLDLRERPGFAPTFPPTARLAWTSWPEYNMFRAANELTRFYVARLENPHPEREVVSLALEAADEPGSYLAVFAMTLERVDDAALVGSFEPTANRANWVR